jgi:UDP-glucose 4-epimerase
MEKTLQGERYLVTGASGFIGRAVCSHLLKAGASIDGVSRTAVDLEDPNYRHHQVDLASASEVDAVFERIRPQFVLHLAGCVTGNRNLEWVHETLVNNLVSTVNLLVAARKWSVDRCVLAGSLEEPPADEIYPVPASPYAASKWAVSGYARMFHELYGLRVSVARIFMVYGPGQQDVRKLVPYVCLSAASGQAPKLMSGTRPVDWIYVQDVVEGLVTMLHGGPEDGSHVDLGTGLLSTTGDVAVRLCELAAGSVTPELGVLEDRMMEQVRRADIKATHAQIEWQAATGLEDGLRRTFEWYRDAWREGRLNLSEDVE